MNDLLKILSKSLQPFGYHIRPGKGLTFLKIPGLENAGNAENIGEIRKAIQTTIPTLPKGNIDQIEIFLRSCLRDRRNVNPRPRLTGDDAFENGYRCVRSLVRSINDAVSRNKDLKISLTVLDDRSDAAAIDELKRIVSTAQCKVDFRTTEQTGQGASLHQAFFEARGKDALVYCVEDDYLHEQDAIFRLWEFYKHMAAQGCTHMVLYPQEHGRLYSEHYPSYIVAGADRHWRSMRHATHTFMTHGSVVDKYWRFFENTKFVGNKKKRRAGSESRTTDKLFTKIPGFSPLRPCAVHLQYEELLPHFYDWRPLWDMNGTDAAKKERSA